MDPKSPIIEENVEEPATMPYGNAHRRNERTSAALYEQMRQRTCFRVQTATTVELDGKTHHHERLVYSHVPNTRVKSRFYREHLSNMMNNGQQQEVPVEDDWSIPCTTISQMQEGSSSSRDADDHEDEDDDASSVESLGFMSEVSEQGERHRVDVPRLDLTKALDIQRMDMMQRDDRK